MGLRGELFSTKVALQNRTYFFNVKENRLGDLYLNIVESKNRDEGGFERQSVILFADDLQDFLQGFDESLRVLEKAAREKRRGRGAPAGRRFERDNRDDREERDNRGERDFFERGEGRRRPDSAGTGRRSERPARSSRPRDGNTGRSFRGPGSFDRDSGGAENRRKRPGNKDNDRRPSNYRGEEKREFTPRKKRVVVKKP